MTDIWSWGAGQTALAIAGGQVSAREVAQATLARIDAVNPALNALVSVQAEAALAQADAVDAARARGEALPPLAGVPATTKVNVDFKGLPTTNGIEACADLIATADSPPVAGLRAAGAVFVGRSNTPCFSLRWFTDNALHGRTLNPWNPEVSPGGSSGGAAVALATGMGAIGHGNDYGGSIRHPAAMCGVVGLRPTSGRVPAYNPSAASERPLSAQMFSVQGPLARSVGDCALALDAMARPDPRDPLAAPVSPVLGANRKPARVGVYRASGLCPVSPEVTAAIDHAAKLLADAGLEVEDVTLPHFEEANTLWREMVYSDLRRAMMPALTGMGDAAVQRNIELILENTPELSGEEVLNLYTRRMAIARDWAAMFARHEVVLTANSWVHALPIDADLVSAEASDLLLAQQSPLLATAMLGLPGLSVPMGLAGGLPASVQLLARWFDEAALVTVGQMIEAAAPAVTPITPAL